MCLDPLYICICHYINTLELNTRQASCYSPFHDAKENVMIHVFGTLTDPGAKVTLFTALQEYSVLMKHSEEI